MPIQQPRGRAGDGATEFALVLDRARLLLESARLEEAEREFERAVTLRPADPIAQHGLARLRYMRGDVHFARDLAAAVAANRGDGLLQLHFAHVLHQTGDLAGAELLLRDLIARAGPLPEVRSSLATVLHSAGRLLEAEQEARAACRARPTDAAMAHTLVAVLLSSGHADAALPLIRAARQRAPLDGAWIAAEATAARLTGDPAYAALYDYRRLVGVYELEAPNGWRSMAEFNAALVESLSARHFLVRHPFDQTLRSGTQTMGNLLHDADPLIQAALTAFFEPIADYRAKLGEAPDHPLSARNRGETRYVGCWSVRLGQNGFHVNHVHPEGWLSSAYYVAVPTESADVNERLGWLAFGEPALPVPGAGPGYTVQPKPGRLVLFPSYMWHGTTPIRGTEQRLTMAFDVVPGPGGVDAGLGVRQ